jgi:hypothetical protein
MRGQRVDLVDFSMVVMINLSICLFIALFFVPALMEKLPLQGQTVRPDDKEKKAGGSLQRHLPAIYSFWQALQGGLYHSRDPGLWHPGILAPGKARG